MNTGLKLALGVCSLSLLFSCAQKLPYQDTSLTAEQRAEDLLLRLTLEEKVALMQNASPAIPRLGIKDYHSRYIRTQKKMKSMKPFIFFIINMDESLEFHQNTEYLSRISRPFLHSL